MNQIKLTAADKDKLFSIICYGRGTPANLARALGIDRRTAQRLISPEHLADIIQDPAEGDIGRWYALLDEDLHSWETSDGCFHVEAKTAVAVRDDLAFLVKEIVGDALKRRMLMECPKKDAIELRRLLDRDFLIPSGVMRHYHYRAKSVKILDANGDEI